MLRGGALPAVAVAVPAVALGALLAGRDGAAGAAAGSAAVAASSLLTLVTMLVTRHVAPELALGAALLTYSTKVVALGLALLAWREATWMSPTAFALSVLAGVLAWTAGELRAFARLRLPVFDTAVPGTADRS